MGRVRAEEAKVAIVVGSSVVAAARVAKMIPLYWHPDRVC